jgi:RNA polymerase sigma factor (sigma-70 family)
MAKSQERGRVSRFGAVRRKNYPPAYPPSCDLRSLKKRPPLNTCDERILIEACRQGDRRAQRAVFDRYFLYVARICRNFCDHPDELPELINDVFCRVFEKLATFEGDTLKGWIGTIARNLGIDYARRHRRAAGHVLAHADLMLDRGVPPVVLATLEWEDLSRLFAALPPLARAVVEHFVRGFKHREIAQALNISVEQSKWHLHQSRRTLGLLFHEPDEL